MLWSLLLISLPILAQGARMDCSRAEYDKCIKIADPLVKEAHLVFPDNLNDIDQVCNTWNQFVDCLKRYTDECFTEQQKRQFNRAVESPIESVHEMCTQPSYQKEYLRYAPCIKSTIVQRIHCGPQYSLLVDQVDQGDIISKSTLCCSHDRFKQCVQRETRRLCDRGILDGPASRFATQIIDKALRFLQEQCINYIPNSGDCSIHPTGPYGDRTDSLVMSTIPSDFQSWSTYQEARPKEDVLTSISPSRNPSTLSWGSSSVFPTGRSFPTIGDVSVNNEFLGSRTRPGSYGRASSWNERSENQALGSNTIQMFPEMSSTRSTRPEWSSSVGWENRQPSTSPSMISSTRSPLNAYTSSRSIPEVTSEVWYPVAGNHLSNEVDSPNQLGLQKAKNNASILKSSTVMYCLVIFILNALLI